MTTTTDHRAFTRGTPVMARDASQTGQLTGSRSACALAGCRGARLTVQWPDGRRSFPCTKGMDYDPERGWVIL